MARKRVIYSVKDAARVCKMPDASFRLLLDRGVVPEPTMVRYSYEQSRHGWYTSEDMQAVKKAVAQYRKTRANLGLKDV